MTYRIPCPNCSGSGLEGNGALCSDCRGTGQDRDEPPVEKQPASVSVLGVKCAYRSESYGHRRYSGERITAAHDIDFDRWVIGVYAGMHDESPSICQSGATLTAAEAAVRAKAREICALLAPIALGEKLPLFEHVPSEPPLTSEERQLLTRFLK